MGLVFALKVRGFFGQDGGEVLSGCLVFFYVLSTCMKDSFSSDRKLCVLRVFKGRLCLHWKCHFDGSNRFLILPTHLQSMYTQIV